MTRVLRITAKRAGFRRCGIAHPAHAVDHAPGRFTAEEVARLKAEPMLVVEERSASAGPVTTDLGTHPEGAPGTGTEKPGPGAVEPTREDRIRAAMRELDPETQPAAFTASGKPKAEVLQERTGIDGIGAKERDALWAEVTAETA